MRWIIIIQFLLPAISIIAQEPCNRKGQTPNSAYIVCGNGTQSIAPSSSCFNGNFYLPGCTNENTSYGDLNAVYFKFNCKTAGSLAFVIAAWKPEDDLNWQLFDITGKNPNSVFNDRFATIAANWSGTTGPTGASGQGSSSVQCRTFVGQGQPANTFSSMPQLNENHTYLLMVSNISFTGGFALTIDGGTADISGDVATPLKAETSTCNDTQMKLIFSKSVRCSSITATGTEFVLQPANASINSVSFINCTADEADSILINFSQPLITGNYTLSVKSGTDGNTIQDNCGNLMEAGSEIKFSISPYPVIDSINIPKCRPDKIRLLLSKQTMCNSIATDGSDFIINGPSAVAISSAATVCTNGTTNEIELILQNPITASGVYTVQLKAGTDGSTITDDCNNSTPAGFVNSFNIKGNVDAGFFLSIAKGCIADTVSFIHPGGNDVNTWSWNFNDNTSSSLKEPVKIFSTGGIHTASLYVSNGQCFDNLEKTFVLDEKLKADFDIPTNACSNQLITIINKSKAAINYNWDFGNGVQSALVNPLDQTYPASAVDKTYPVTLNIQNNGCVAAITKNILIKANCFVFLPNSFTPNNDGLNDLFGPLNSSGIADLRFKVFNRYGLPIFQSNSPLSSWDGTFKSEKQPPGLYIWTLEYTDVFSNKKILQRGTVFLLR